ncbi:MAG: ribonuclease HI family protein [Planctomycetota bacterium]
MPPKSEPKGLIIHCDGGAWNNPGPAAFAYVIRDEHGAAVERRGEYIGETTNNVAEYRAVIAAVRRAAELGAGRVVIRLDSQLVHRQLSGRYRVKAKHLKPLFAELKALIDRLPQCRLEHVGRDRNREADRLVQEAIDRRGVVT